MDNIQVFTKPENTKKVNVQVDERVFMYLKRV